MWGIRDVDFGAEQCLRVQAKFGLDPPGLDLVFQQLNVGLPSCIPKLRPNFPLFGFVVFYRTLVWLPKI